MWRADYTLFSSELDQELFVLLENVSQMVILSLSH